MRLLCIFLNSQRHTAGGRIYKVCFIFSTQMRRTELSTMKLPSVLPLPALHILNNFLADQVKSDICFRKHDVIVQLDVCTHSATWVNNLSV